MHYLLLLSTLASSLASAAPSQPYAMWAHSHFVWISSSPPASSILSYVQAYQEHNISVGGYDIDSAWATGFNTFSPTPTTYPGTSFPDLISELHTKYGIRTILWMTSMVDTDSPNYAEAKAKDYLVKDVLGGTSLKWWHGTGGLLDYSNPEAVQWWEGQMKAVLHTTGDDRGVDGWKCDGTDPYIIELLGAHGFGGNITYPQYANYYYGHTLNFTRSIQPDALIWSRPVDSFPLFLNISAYLPYSPHYVMFSGWVGDQDPTFSGLNVAIGNMFQSAWHNYTNFGSDTGGYRAGNRTREVFIRWAQLNAFMPLFENGGDGDHTPWGFDAPTATSDVTDAYRRLVNAHYALTPYLYATGVASFAGGVSSIHPLTTPPPDFPFIIERAWVRDGRYFLGPSLLAAPVISSGVEATIVELPPPPPPTRWPFSYTSPPPPTAPPTWYDFWNHSAVHPAGTSVTYATPLHGKALLHPVFVLSGSMLPLHVSTPSTTTASGGGVAGVHAAPHWAAALTLVVQDLAPGARAGLSGAVLDDDPLSLAATTHALDAEVGGVWGGRMNFSHSPFSRPIILLLRSTTTTTITLHAGSASTGAPRVTWRSRGSGDGGENGGVLPHVQAPHHQHHHSGGGGEAALFWDAVVPGRSGPGRKGVGEPALVARYEQELAGRFLWDEEEGEVILFLSAQQSRVGGEASIEWR
jgi:hypothetical protein